MKIIDDKTILLCKKGSCCPKVIQEDEGTVRITDDFGGEIKLTSDELDMLSEAIEVLKKKN